MKILISGGGTGGHLIPGIALYQQFKIQQQQVLYIMSERDKAYDISSLLLEKERLVVSLTGISRKLSLSTFKQLYSIFKVWLQSFQNIKKFNPDVVIITGGYLSNIAALSALLLRKPLYILEQNSAAGITNRFWSNFAKKIFTTFPNPKFIASHKEIYTGNPLCYTEHLDVIQAKKILGLELNNKPVIGISGGSQGAKKINDMVLSLIPNLIQHGYQIVWSLGTKEFERFSTEGIFEFLNEYSHSLKTFRFIERMDAFWSASTIVVARSGAGTVSESLFFKVPTLFIPIFQSPDDHQLLNATYLSNYQCAKIIEEPFLTKESLLLTISDMIEQNSIYKEKFPSSHQSPAQEISNYILNIH